MGDKGYSTSNLWGGYDHYDSNGRKIGSSEPNIFGGYTNYDAKGNKTGHSTPGLFGGYDHFDAKGHRTGHSTPGLWGSYDHFNANGKHNGISNPTLFGSYSNDTSGGCYIATCVYGSYDTPEVWTLRRFRDSYLGKRMWGRAFIRAYYAFSPKLVSKFGNAAWFQRFWRKALNHIVSELHQRGYDDSPYSDINWRKMK